MSTLPDAQGARTLYQELKDRCGTHVVEFLVADLYDGILDDPELGQFFEDVPRKPLERKMMQFLCFAMGHGNWGGKSIAEAHAHLNIQDYHFDLVMHHIGRALAKNSVPQDLIQRIADLGSSLRKDIVTA